MECFNWDVENEKILIPIHAGIQAFTVGNQVCNTPTISLSEKEGNVWPVKKKKKIKGLLIINSFSK